MMADLAGQPVIMRSVVTFARTTEIGEIIVVASGECANLARSLPALLGFETPVRCVPGGAERHLSVLEGLAAVSPQATLVAVHDGARPLLCREDLSRVIARARETGAAALAHPVTDTVKRADDSGKVIAAVDRDGLWAMETPQVFAVPVLRSAYRAVMANGAAPTDEVSVVAASGVPVFLVPSRSINLKITGPQDLEFARQCLTRLPRRFK
jgi:2-C-methyl-D-erythritol 4-phosphate cytidylyltransferase